MDRDLPAVILVGGNPASLLDDDVTWSSGGMSCGLDGPAKLQDLIKSHRHHKSDARHVLPALLSSYLALTLSCRQAYQQSATALLMSILMSFCPCSSADRLSLLGRAVDNKPAV